VGFRVGPLWDFPNIKTASAAHKHKREWAKHIKERVIHIHTCAQYTYTHVRNTHTHTSIHLCAMHIHTKTSIYVCVNNPPRVFPLILHSSPPFASTPPPPPLPLSPSISRSGFGTNRPIGGVGANFGGRAVVQHHICPCPAAVSATQARLPIVYSHQSIHCAYHPAYHTAYHPDYHTAYHSMLTTRPPQIQTTSGNNQ